MGCGSSKENGLNVTAKQLEQAGMDNEDWIDIVCRVKVTTSDGHGYPYNSSTLPQGRIQLKNLADFSTKA